VIICFLAIECPSGAVYQQCGSLCPQTCDSTATSNCPSGCAEGCFCSEGLVSYDGACVDRSVCPGKVFKYFTFTSRMYVCMSTIF